MGLSQLIDIIASGDDDRITDVTRRALMCLVDQYCLLQDQILIELERKVMAWHRSSEASKRLATMPGIGPLAAPRARCLRRRFFEL
jgi:transposase